jgi:hypothetical protein
MTRPPDHIVAHGRLAVLTEQPAPAGVQLPLPSTEAEFELELAPDQLEPGLAQFGFRVHAADWHWSAATIEWCYRTSGWVHFGGTASINNRWLTYYRAHVSLGDGRQPIGLSLRGYTLDSTVSPRIVFALSTADDERFGIPPDDRSTDRP